MLNVREDKNRKNENGTIYLELLKMNFDNPVESNRLGYWCDKLHLEHCFKSLARMFTEEEVRKLLKDIEPPKEFKIGQPVLVRDLAELKWEYGIFGRYVHGDSYPYKCIGNSYVYCIPFEGNEHLLGKC